MTFVSSEFCWPVRWDSSRSPQGEVSSLFDPAKRSASGGATGLKLSLWCGFAACQVNSVGPLGKYLDRLSGRQSSRQSPRRRSGVLQRRTRTTGLAARHTFAVTLEAELGWNFVVSLVASFVATSRSRIETVMPQVSLLCDPAKRSTAGGATSLQNIQSPRPDCGSRPSTRPPVDPC